MKIRAGHFFISGFLFLLSFTSLYSIGPCEDFSHELTFLGHSRIYSQFAVREDFSFCAEGPEFYQELKVLGVKTPDEFHFSFIKVYNQDGTIKRRFLFSDNQELFSALRKVKTGYSLPIQDYLEGEVLGKDLITTHLQQGKFTIPASTFISPSGKYRLTASQPLVGQDNAPFRWLFLNLESTRLKPGQPGRSLNAFPLAVIKGDNQYTGYLSLEPYWFDLSDKNNHQKPLLLILLRQKGGWMPGAPGSLETEELIWLSPETIGNYQAVETGLEEDNALIRMFEELY